jgi:hypothetical protein
MQGMVLCVAVLAMVFIQMNLSDALSGTSERFSFLSNFSELILPSIRLGVLIVNGMSLGRRTMTTSRSGASSSLREARPELL